MNLCLAEPLSEPALRSLLSIDEVVLKVLNIPAEELVLIENDVPRADDSVQAGNQNPIDIPWGASMENGWTPSCFSTPGLSPSASVIDMAKMQRS